jgi:hypothetical protein
VDDAVGRGRAGSENVEVGKLPAKDLCTHSDDGVGRSLGAGQAHDLMPGPEQLRNDRGADET